MSGNRVGHTARGDGRWWHATTGPQRLRRTAIALSCAGTALLGAFAVLGPATSVSASTISTPAGATQAPAPKSGTITGTVTITGAPKGFTPAFSGVGGCPAPAKAICPSPHYSIAGKAGAYTLQLPAGDWTLAGWYELAPFGGQFVGMPVTVDVVPGKTTTANVTVAYRPPGTVAGTITVTGVPHGVTIEAKVALACPSKVPFNGGQPSILCVEGGGSSGAYRISTLPPGSWILYPEYFTEFGQVVG